MITRSLAPFCLLMTVFLITALAKAQQPKKVPRIGYLTTTSNPTIAGPHIEIFRQALQDLGYIEGKNIHIEFRYIEGQQDRVPILIAELVQLKVDVLLASTLTSIRAAKQATTTIPIVMVTTGDPVATGIVDSLARPGGNITGLTRLTRELNGKRLELLKEAVPWISRVGVLWDPRGPGPTISFKEYEAAATSLKIKLQSLEVRNANPDFESSFQSAAKGHASAILAITSSVLQRHARRIVGLAIKNRLPAMYEQSQYVDAGGLMSYSADDAESYRRAAWYVDRILKGTKPADLPVEQPMKFEFVINLKTAKQIGLTIPPSVLYQADRMIK